VQAHEWGKYVGRADFEYRNGEFKLVKYALIPVNLMKSVKGADGKTSKVPYTVAIAEDKDMLAMLKPYQDFGQQKLMVEIGSTDGRLEGDRAIVRSKPASMAVLIGRASLERTNADFAVVNAGGVRDSLNPGKLTYKDVLKVQPFGNTTAVVDLSGKEVMDYLNAIAKMTAGSGAFPQFAGINLVIANGQVESASIKGAPIAMGKTYRMVLNNFIAAGGDGYPKLTAHPSYVDTGYVDADVLRAYITAHSPLKAADFDPGSAVVRR
jgi:5'-nucleotidase / UDP-sugar diphosphatase